LLTFDHVLQFSIGQEVWIMNPKRSTQKVAMGTISDVGGEAKFHFVDIPNKWFKIIHRSGFLL
jgi:hypothetical protein